MTEEVRYIHAVQAQSLFDTVRAGADSKGMKLNPKKPVPLCISAAKSYKPKSCIRLGEDDLILSGKTMKLLGFHFDSRPSVDAHVNAILKKVHHRTWSLHLSLIHI